MEHDVDHGPLCALHAVDEPELCVQFTIWSISDALKHAHLADCLHFPSSQARTLCAIGNLGYVVRVSFVFGNVKCRLQIHAILCPLVLVRSKNSLVMAWRTTSI